MKYEYLLFTTPTAMAEEIDSGASRARSERHLNKLGADGWNFLAVMPGVSPPMMLFQRERVDLGAVDVDNVFPDGDPREELRADHEPTPERTR